MQRLEFTGNVGKIGIEDGIAFCLPPKPVLHDRIKRNVLFAITMRNPKQLVLRNITVFRLEETVCPLWQHGRVTAQVAILVHDLIHLGPVDNVVIDRVRGQRTELKGQRKPVVRISERRGVPQERVALTGNQQRDGNVCVVLSQFDRAATIVEHPTLMLAETVKTLRGIR